MVEFHCNLLIKCKLQAQLMPAHFGLSFNADGTPSCFECSSGCWACGVYVRSVDTHSCIPRSTGVLGDGFSVGPYDLVLTVQALRPASCCCSFGKDNRLSESLKLPYPVAAISLYGCVG